MAKTTATKPAAAKIVITLRDEEGGNLSYRVESSPPATEEDAPLTPAQAEAAALLEWLAQRAEERGDGERGDGERGDHGA